MMDHMLMQMNECHDFVCEMFSNFTQKLGCYTGEPALLVLQPRVETK
jgi:hypothetical protein